MGGVLPASTWIEDRSGNCLAAFADSDGNWSIPLRHDELSPHLLHAIVAIEDSRFYQHHGVDWRSVFGAVWDDGTSLNLHRGASTIPMQLLRLRDPAPHSLLNKVFQAIGGAQIDRRLTKDQILVDYLNAAPFGGNLVGAGAASWRYFNRPCRDLSLGQAALLAGLPQNPNRLRPDRNPSLARARRNHVLDRMLACGMITHAQRDQAANEAIDAAWHALPQNERNGLLPTLADLAGESPGETLKTTIDSSIEHEASLATHQCLQSLSASHVTAAAVVVLDTATGQCLAAVSLTSVGESNGNSIDLTQCPHSSGSTLKPFIYATAFDEGICGPGSILQDSPIAWADYAPKDYDRNFLGPIPASDALAQSRNLPAMVLLSKVGVPRAVQVMGSMGLTTLSQTPDRFGLSLAIGGASVTPMELADAYATLARGGRHRRASFFEDQAQTASSPLRAEQCREALYCLADPARTARVCPSAESLWPAWKTGTSSGHRDAWCAAVTPRRTVVVWLGNTNGSGSNDLVGQEIAAPLALQVLVSSDQGGPGFMPPPDFDSMSIASSIASAAAPLAMLSPVADQQVVRDPGLPADQQRLALRARVTAPNTNHLWWFIDGSAVGEAGPDQPLLWPLALGRHEATAMTADGQAAHVQFVVR